MFDRVLFPVLEELLKPQVYERDPKGLSETRLKAATLLCKIFLQYVVRLVESGSSEAVTGLFVRVLDKLEKFMRGERDLLVSLLLTNRYLVQAYECLRTKQVNR